MTTQQLVGDQHEIEEEHLSARNSFWVPDPAPAELLTFRPSKTTWRMGRIFAERQFHRYDEPQEAYISEVGATCVATQVKGPNIGMLAILKIRKQIPTGGESPRDVEPEDLQRTKPCRLGIWASYEFCNLDTLTESGCSCRPRLLGRKLVSQGLDDLVPGGFILLSFDRKITRAKLS
ncbi:hypothetical protein AJ80_03353 [Polytolypa hystricis UAMH7299]|uniref:Uncharacterized protein n=1 Tax=Polytolypa hystricis (strain UAMH7299) TaxID=1447883 RepID=A0A2B7YJW7_POLH7|nr:hypothetical protein AJ80_03353 [Polytolypa hystricis UAMH7299]